ncbi:MAG: hypothetical protein U0892_14195 [Pirellulales bacterium]
MSDHDEPVLTLEELLGPIPDESSEEEHQTETSSASGGYVYRESDSYKLFPTATPTTSDSVSDKTPSKSKRIREFLEANPDARNRDVVEALTEFGITAADVSNAKAQLKRKGTPAKRGRPAAASESGSEKSSAPAGGPAAAIGMNEIEAALNFVRQMGSLDRARQLLVIIQQIQQL